MPIAPSTPRSAEHATTAIIIGVDTHKYAHVAVAISRLGTRLGACSTSANRAGYMTLLTWARGLGTVDAFAVEGTGSYGAGLASLLRRRAIHVVEVNHCDRRKRRKDGKNDTLDAESAVRSVLAGTAIAVPKSADGTAEMVRQLKVARDTAVKARSAAMIALKTLIVNAPAEPREELEPLRDRLLNERCAQLVPEQLRTPAATLEHALRALARRWRLLSAEIAEHDTVLDALTAAAVPTLRAAFGIGPDAAAEMLIVAGETRRGSAPMLRSQSSAAPARSPPRAGSRTGIASSAAGTGKPTRPSTGL